MTSMLSGQASDCEVSGECPCSACDGGDAGAKAAAGGGWHMWIRGTVLATRPVMVRMHFATVQPCSNCPCGNTPTPTPGRDAVGAPSPWVVDAEARPELHCTLSVHVRTATADCCMRAATATLEGALPLWCVCCGVHGGGGSRCWHMWLVAVAAGRLHALG